MGYDQGEKGEEMTAPYRTKRKVKTKHKTTTVLGKREYQRLYMRQYRKKKKGRRK